MADKRETTINFRAASNGFIIRRNTAIFDDKGIFKKEDSEEFVSTSASETKKIVQDLTEKLKDEIKT